MIDGPSFSALLERCAPGAPVEPLTALVRQASGFEPLVIGTDGRKPLTIQATSKPEAIELATELEIGEQRVWVGLAQIDSRQLKRLGISLADGFEPCTNIKVAAQLLNEKPSFSKPARVSENPRTARAEPSPGEGARSLEVWRSEHGESRPSWDAYSASRRPSVFVYAAPD